MPAAPEVMFGPYRVQDLLGRGGMGEVHRAYDTVHGRTVALKRLSGALAGADDRGRFRRESRLAASVREPHVVQVYDYGEIDDQLYLAMQLVEGTDLRTVLEGGPLEPQRAVELLTDVATAIDAAHAGGVLHRDVKPSNILIDESGTAYLADFGIAKPADGDATSLTRTGNEIGTLDYMAPERVLRQGAERRSDVYALACVLFQCVTGKLPFPAEDTAGKLAAQLHTPPPTPSLFGWRVPQELDLVVATGMDKDPARRYPSAGELMAAAAVAIAQPSTTATMPTIPEFAADPGRERIMRAIVEGAGKAAAIADPATAPAADRQADQPCPYPGLRSFGAGDAGAFFGREQALTDLLVRLSRLSAESGPLVLVGASGSGKSSLLHAGVLPALERAGGPPWPQLALTPGPSPLDTLAARLAPLAGMAAGDLARWLWQRPAEFGKLTGQIAHQHGGEHSRLVVVVDQFEELFTVADRRQREVFATALASAWPALVVLAVRADFLEDCIRLDVLRPALAGAHLLGPLSAGELERVITEPAKVAGIAVEPGLTDRLLTDIGARDSTGYDPGALPRLAHALRETWQHRSGNTLTLQGYQATGGIERAVALTADSIYNGLDEHGKAQLRTALLRMVTVLDRGGVARRKSAPGGIPAWLVQHLVDARLVTAESDGVQLSHDALLTAWPRLREWVEQDRQGLVIHQHLGEAAAAWESSGRDHGELYRGARLSAALEWAGGRRDLSDTEQSFLRESRRAQRRTTRRLAGLVAGLSVFLVLALVAGVLAVIARNDAVRGRQLAESRQLAAESIAQAHSDPVAARRMALRAWQASHTVEARGALLSNVTYPFPQRLDSGLAGGVAVDVSSDGSLIAAGGRDGRVAVLDARTGRAVAEFAGHGKSVQEVEFSPDGTLLATTTANDAGVRIWAVPSGELVQELPAFGAVSWRPDGAAIASVSFLGDDKLAVGAWDPRTGRLAGWLTEPGSPASSMPYTIAYNEDGSRLAVGMTDGVVTLWNPATAELVHGSAAHRDAAREGMTTGASVDFSRDRLVSATGADRKMRLWDPDTGKPKNSITIHGWPNQTGSRATFAAGGGQLLTRGTDGLIKWNVDRRERAGSLPMGPTPGEIRSAALIGVASADNGDVVAVQGNGTVLRWAHNRHWYDSPTETVIDASFSPSGDRLLAVGRSGVQVWNPATGRAEPRSEQMGKPAVSGAFVESGGRVVAHPNGELTVTMTTGATRTLEMPGTRITSAAMATSADGKQIAVVVGRDDPDSWAVTNEIYVYDTRSWEKLAQLAIGNGVVGVPAFINDGRELILVMNSVPDPNRPEASVSKIRSWRTSDFVEQPQVRLDSPGSMVPAPDGKALLMVRGHKIAVVDPATGDVIREFGAHPAAVTEIAVSPDGTLVATATATEPVVRLWDLGSGALVATLTGHQSYSTGLSFSADGARLASSSADTDVGIWLVRPGDAVQRLCADLVRAGEPASDTPGC